MSYSRQVGDLAREVARGSVTRGAALGGKAESGISAIYAWGHSSVGRARALQARGHRFEPGCLHSYFGRRREMAGKGMMPARSSIGGV